MERKKFFALHASTGFTLIEILASIVILSAVAIGMFSFFTNAMKYTTYNQGKTVAINIARGILAYMEHRDFTALKQYVDEQIHNTDEPFARIDASHCSSSLFENQQVCEALLRPTINNVTYDEKRVHLFLVPYNDTETWNKLQNSPPPEFPSSLKQKIKGESIKNTDPNLQNYLLKIYVIVRWGDKEEDAEWLEGVIANETIR
ncbi:type IV pilus modification PilV family protein [Thermaerobacillus caldiproteolyticus]|uniref:Prepilin-type N-terminal cleavage/methylation domain-containing protein n=1 Tax=Thermaerobacillus caldiproteolyticus TaxID=247480 RepID=A0A7V9Z424_9BACL|nr:type II secretion system protein [Anoxybacillus caldiproteolyticus]MBA2873672.1 prepilin-type N-terminal cleavage/methylation domain-containing protein [Anoxybacillus caldiproteolyticus]